MPHLKELTHMSEHFEASFRSLKADPLRLDRSLAPFLGEILISRVELLSTEFGHFNFKER